MQGPDARFFWANKQRKRQVNTMQCNAMARLVNQSVRLVTAVVVTVVVAHVCMYNCIVRILFGLCVLFILAGQVVLRVSHLPLHLSHCIRETREWGDGSLPLSGRGG